MTTLDDARANARAVRRAWANEIARLNAATIIPEDVATIGDLDAISDALEDAQATLDSLDALRGAMMQAIERMRRALSTSENA